MGVSRCILVCVCVCLSLDVYVSVYVGVCISVCERVHPQTFVKVRKTPRDKGHLNSSLRNRIVNPGQCTLDLYRKTGKEEGVSR